MLTKFETKSNRVKGLAFHPKRPWILASLHSGVIQLWDYRMGTLIDRFAEHDGPVRGVEFHASQPIFVSGGDDNRVKVWNYKTRRCLFTLTGHLDYIRTVQFHPENPWIISGSDDQTIRIWNWQSRQCMAVLTGHNHYVMCAAFHHKEDLVVSASLDQTVRVWDISGLRKKSVAPRGEESNMNTDLFGGGDAVVKYVLEGHDRGVNWASFHPTLPLIVSGADDRQVKLWRMNESKAWEVDTLRGHMNNVSCVMFHGKQDLIISNSEDRSIRVWDMSKRAAVQTFRREHDRFWILTSHPEINLLAAGHDSGMIVFKLVRERPAHAVSSGHLFYVSERALRHVDLASGRNSLVLMMAKPHGQLLNAGTLRTMSYNPAENTILVTSDDEGGSYQLYQLPKGPPGSVVSSGEVSATYRGLGSCAVFIARNRFAVWDKITSQIQIRNLQNEITKKTPPPDGTTNAFFYAGTGMLLCRCDDKVILFDVQQRIAVAEMPTPAIKYVAWNADMSVVALLSKHAIVVADAKLKNSCTVHETIRVKSAAWSDTGVLIYTTLNHIKYCLPNGDSGIVRTLDTPIYIVSVIGNTIHALDREGKMRQIQVESAEYMFKLALMKRDYDKVLSIIKSNQLCGQAIIACLRKKGFPEVALHFVRDDRTRFSLAVECGNIEVALETAERLDDKDIWYKLGVEALRHGNYQIVEFCYQRTKSYERLSFLYVITGNTEKLRKMLKMSEMRNDVMSRYQNALYLGSIRDRVTILRDAGHHALAYVTAKTHGLEAEAAKIAETLGDELPETSPDAALMMPPTPILREDNWPLLTVTKGLFEGKFAIEAGAGAAGRAAAPEIDFGDVEAGGAWGEELDLAVAPAARDADADGHEVGADDEDGGWDLEDLELPADMPAAPGITGVGAAFVAPSPGQSVSQKWMARSRLAAEHVAAGSFDTAMRMLKLQLGIHNFEPLKQHFLDVHAAAFATVPAFSNLPSLATGIEREWDKNATTAPPQHPALPFGMTALEGALKRAYKLVTEGKFNDALKAFDNMLLTIPLMTVPTRKDVDEVKELLHIIREYHIALRCELARKEVKEDNSRTAELAAYFTHCKLQPVHLLLSLNSAMKIFFKQKLYGSCATFCRRLLELQPPEKIGQQARQVLAVCEKTPTDSETINYDPRNPFDICSITFTPIYKGSRFVECPYTGAKFTPECEGKLSPLGNIAKIGADASGLVCSSTQIR